MRIVNNTPYTLGAIAALPLLGYTASQWRQRRIALYEHPTDTTLLVSCGTTFDGGMQVIATEPRSAWTTALDYIAHGQVYISQ